MDDQVQQARPAAGIRLLCAPHAGGGASLFKAWADDVAPHIEIVAVQLPGRESRMLEDPVSDMPSIVEPLFDEVKQFDDKPMAFFGHSLGAKVLL